MSGEEKSFFVHPSSYIDEGVQIGEGTKIWHFCHLQSGVIIGRFCTFGQNVNVGNNVRIGNYVKIQNNVSVYEGVELEDYVFCGPGLVFTNVLFPRSEFPQRGTRFYQRTIVKRGATLGANATIICGITVGEYAFVAAGAVVTKDVPDFAMVVGNPARIRGWICRCGGKLNLTFSENYVETDCKKCGRAYRKENGKVFLILR